MTGQLSLNYLSTGCGLTRAELMTAAEVAELLGVPVSTVSEWGRNGTLPRVKLGRHVRFIRAHVEAAIFDAEKHRRRVERRILERAEGPMATQGAGGGQSRL